MQTLLYGIPSFGYNARYLDSSTCIPCCTIYFGYTARVSVQAAKCIYPSQRSARTVSVQKFNSLVTKAVQWCNYKWQAGTITFKKKSISVSGNINYSIFQIKFHAPECYKIWYDTKWNFRKPVVRLQRKVTSPFESHVVETDIRFF